MYGNYGLNNDLNNVTKNPNRGHISEWSLYQACQGRVGVCRNGDSHREK